MKLLEQLKFEEGIRLEAYPDHKGIKTIGVGRNLVANPYFPDGSEIPDHITHEQAEELLDCDVGNTIASLRERWPRIDEFDKARRDAFVNMAFQLGITGFMGFERMRAAALARDWETAYKEALTSKWAKHDTPERALRVAWQMKNGKYYEFPS
jgi:lysozyme